MSPVVETILGIFEWILIAVFGGFFLYLLFSAIGGLMLSSMISRDQNEQDK
jgi:hypothetical protein